MVAEEEMREFHAATAGSAVCNGGRREKRIGELDQDDQRCQRWRNRWLAR